MSAFALGDMATEKSLSAHSEIRKTVDKYSQIVVKELLNSAATFTDGPTTSKSSLEYLHQGGCIRRRQGKGVNSRISVFLL
jgi:hypothetical protein